MPDELCQSVDFFRQSTIVTFLAYESQIVRIFELTWHIIHFCLCFFHCVTWKFFQFPHFLQYFKLSWPFHQIRRIVNKNLKLRLPSPRLQLKWVKPPNESGGRRNSSEPTGHSASLSVTQRCKHFDSEGKNRYDHFWNRITPKKLTNSQKVQLFDFYPYLTEFIR